MPNRRILIVDDEVMFLPLVAQMLVQEGWEVETATSVDDALQCLEASTFGLLLTDLHMGEIGGMELIRQAREAWPNMVVAIMTGYGTTPGVIEAMRLGCGGYLLKPFTREQLLATVQNAMEKNRLEKEQIRLKSLLSLFQFSWMLMRQSNQSLLLQRSVDWIKQETEADHAGILLHDPRSESLHLEVVSGRAPLSSVGLNEAGVCKMAQTVIQQKKSLFIQGGQRHPLPSEEIFQQIPLGTLTYLPMMAQGSVLGVLVLYKRGTARRTDESSTTNLVGIFLRQIAVLLDNRRLLTSIQDNYRRTLRALVTAIEMKDASGRGHAEGVEKYAKWLSGPLSLTAAQRHHLLVAATLHDIGKANSSDALLKNVGRFTPDEIEQMKSHVVDAMQILLPITLDAQVTDAILHHHERWDGGGYPDRLAGETIPLYSRVIAIADTLDAMVAPRTYRSQSPWDEAGAEVIRQRGSQFDPHLVDLFAGLNRDALPPPSS
jgi:response regulator RpfG family c-di-GMP phosphodiesterase